MGVYVQTTSMPWECFFSFSFGTAYDVIMFEVATGTTISCSLVRN
jgi:hypothetical protein